MFFRFVFILFVSMVALSQCTTKVRRGYCPAVKPGSVGICANTCSSDSSCKENLKCCRTACGGTQCVKPLPNPPRSPPRPKSGYCPAVKPGSVGICADTCSSDSSCKENLKCCRNACGGTQCVKPLPNPPRPPPSPKPGNCPAIKPGSAGVCANLCSGDSSCKGNLKCCSNACGGTQCVAPVFPVTPLPPIEKPGICPANEPGSVGICIVQCGNDYECDGDLKCCPNPCGGGVCVSPIGGFIPPQKPGTCPAVKPGTVSICIVECGNDYECKGRLKCCPNACGGGICVDVAEPTQPAEKPGTCPANEPGTSGICIVECANDYECKDDLKCCKNPCGGGVCTKSVEASQPVVKPGVCPAVEPGTGGACANTCDNDSSCPKNLKCCSNACGGTGCVEPEQPSECSA